MIDLTKITPDEANKIECALLQLHNDVMKFADTYDKLSKDKSLPEATRNTMATNRDWWIDVYALIYAG